MEQTKEIKKALEDCTTATFTYHKTKYPSEAVDVEYLKIQEIMNIPYVIVRFGELHIKDLFIEKEKFNLRTLQYMDGDITVTFS